MLNPFADVNWKPDREARRSFARSLVIGFPIVAMVLSVITRLNSHEWKIFPLWLGAIGGAVGIVLWILPQLARPFYVVWYFIGCCIGIVTGNLLFTILYYLVLTPIGLAMRALGRDPLRKQLDKTTPTYWKDAEKVVDLRRYYRQF